MISYIQIKFKEILTINMWITFNMITRNKCKNDCCNYYAEDNSVIYPIKTTFLIRFLFVLPFNLIIVFIKY